MMKIRTPAGFKRPNQGRTSRMPSLFIKKKGSLAFRFAERRNTPTLNQLPPRAIRKSPEAGPVGLLLPPALL